MRSNNMLSFVLISLFAFTNALPSATTTHAKQLVSIASAKLSFNIYDFLIKDVDSRTTTEPHSNATTSSLSFNFTDLNSNTSTTCSTTWTSPATPPLGPSYILCGDKSLSSSSTEFFIFHFNAYDSAKNFSLALAHEFDDPTHYPAPYSAVEYFSRSTSFSLACSHQNATKKCSLPHSQSPVHAIVDSISN